MIKVIFVDIDGMIIYFDWCFYEKVFEVIRFVESFGVFVMLVIGNIV